MADSLTQKLLWQPLLSMKKSLITAFLALLVLSAAHGALVLLVGPLLTAMLGAEGEVIGLIDLLPPYAVSLFSLQQVKVETSSLKWWIPSLILVVGVLKSLSSYLYQLEQKSISIKVAGHYRQSLFESILKQDFLALSKKTTGQWMSILLNDVHFLEARFSEMTGNLLRDSFIILAAIAALFLVHWPMALLLLAISPILAFFVGRIGRRIAHFAEGWQRELSHISSLILSLRERFDFIRGQSGEAAEKAAFLRLNQGYLSYIKKSLLIRSGFAPWLEFIGILGFVLSIMVTARGTFFSDLGPAELFQLFAAIGILLRPLRNIGEQMSRFQETMGALSSSLKVLRATRKESKSRAKGFSLPFKGFTVERLQAGYGKKVIFELLKVPIMPGRCVAIIGPSGSGKSSFARTLAGLIPPLSWESKLEWQNLGASTAFVSQTPFLFNGDIRANLNYQQSPPLDDEKLWHSLAKTKMSEELQADQRGLSRKISGVDPALSGGQVQRLVVARALLRQKPIWVLDEATSAVDEEAEQAITRMLIEEARKGGHALFAVTHRVRWLSLFDEVWFIENGRRLYAGKHEDLLQKKRYRSFVTKGA